MTSSGQGWECLNPHPIQNSSHAAAVKKTWNQSLPLHHCHLFGYASLCNVQPNHAPVTYDPDPENNHFGSRYGKLARDISAVCNISHELRALLKTCTQILALHTVSSWPFPGLGESCFVIAICSIYSTI